VMECALYNTVLGGKSLDGKAFTYVNHLASSPTDLSKREEWFECACCPPNVTRLFATLGGYIWGWQESTENKFEINVHLHAAATLRIPTKRGEIVLEQLTNWPWEGKVAYKLQKPTGIAVVIRSRIPEWATIPKVPPYSVEGRNYIISKDKTNHGSEFEIAYEFKPRFIRPHPFTNRNTLAVARGPIVYCVEDVDHPWVTDHFKVRLHLGSRL
jgi:DUF1680 family protein